MRTKRSLKLIKEGKKKAKMITSAYPGNEETYKMRHTWKHGK